MDGLIFVSKPKDCTSRDVVNMVAKITGEKKIGHTGTLDPLATGVLILCLGKYTKLAELITAHQKEYVAKVTLGILTDTLDRTGEIQKEEDVVVTKEEVKKAMEKLIGSYEQEVPLYSAVKINGKKLYEYARSGIAVTLPKHPVTIYEMELLSDIEVENGKPTFTFRALVSKGTYIRSLIYDLSKLLGTVGIMAELTRTKQGDVQLEQCFELDQIKEGKYQVVEPLTLLSNFKTKMIDEPLYQKIKNGAILPNEEDDDHLVFVTKENKVLAIYERYNKDRQLLKPWKMF